MYNFSNEKTIIILPILPNITKIILFWTQNYSGQELKTMDQSQPEIDRIVSAVIDLLHSLAELISWHSHVTFFERISVI